jgi:serine phosphatase RsbU (regulator of sigma subunit)
MLFAIYDENNKTLTIASGGHPAPLLRCIDGRTDSIHLKPSMMLGQSELLRPPQEVQLNLYCGETLIFLARMVSMKQPILTEQLSLV